MPGAQGLEAWKDNSHLVMIFMAMVFFIFMIMVSWFHDRDLKIMRTKENEYVRIT